MIFLLKELKLQLRPTGYLLPSILFCILMHVSYRFSLPQDYIATAESVSLFWLIHTIGFTFLLFSSLEWEYEWDAHQMLKIIKISPAILFLTKLTALLLINVFLLLGSFLPWLLYFWPQTTLNISFTWLILVFSLFAANLTITGFLAATIAVQSAHRQVLQNMIYFPLLIPNFIAASGFTRTLFLTGKPVFGELLLLSAILFFYIAISVIMLPILWED